MKKIYIAMMMGSLALSASAQSAIDAYRLAQPDLKGTARFMSMAGAFGALGGDLSTLSQNPAGIGVYRSSELGFTLGLDIQNAKTSSNGIKESLGKTFFNLNNIGGVAILQTPFELVPNFNIGFTYNKAVSFNREYAGSFIALENSMSNYIAGIANGENLTVADVTTTNNFNPYNPQDGGIAPSWLAVLGYDSYLINPEGNPDYPKWEGQYGKGTSGSANYRVCERGSVDEYNIAFGGNIADVLFWGMNFGLKNLDYSLGTSYGESLQNAYIFNQATNSIEQSTSRWKLNNEYRVSGSGFTYQLGVILKPIQELRIGLAFHTPTWYNFTENYIAKTDMSYFGQSGSALTNDGKYGENYSNLKAPWKFIASLAGVIGQKCILSADYEWAGYNTMTFYQSNNNLYGADYPYYDPWDDFSATPRYVSGDPYEETNKDIRNIYKNTNTLRLGAEYRVTPQVSVRGGYSIVSSPVKSVAKNNDLTIYTAGTIPNYRLDNTTNYVTCGAGYRSGGFYVDLAYVYKNLSSTYHAYTPDPGSSIQSPQAKLTFSNSQLIMSAGVKF